MKFYLSTLLALTLMLLLSSCSGHSSKVNYHAVKHYQPRASTLGFSVTPPPGKNWFEKLKNNSLYYLKISNSHKLYSILTQAREVKLERSFAGSQELLEYVRSDKEKSIQYADYQQGKVNAGVEISLSKNCIRYSQSYEDHGVEGLRGRRHVNVETQGLFCLHPDNSRVAIDVSYVEKSLSDSVSVSYRNEGEIFLASLNFQNVRK